MDLTQPKESNLVLFVTGSNFFPSLAITNHHQTQAADQQAVCAWNVPAAKQLKLLRQIFVQSVAPAKSGWQAASVARSQFRSTLHRVWQDNPVAIHPKAKHPTYLSAPPACYLQGVP